MFECADAVGFALVSDVNIDLCGADRIGKVLLFDDSDTLVIPGIAR
jgi:hypothetical protein